MADLIITNGDIAAELLAAAGMGDEILPWRDVLHEGPIAGDLAACTSVRVPYLAFRFGLDLASILADFTARDALVVAHHRFPRIQLWFEHDLYDQLQLIQIISFFGDVGRRDGLVLVQADDFLGRERPDTIRRFAAKARPLAAPDIGLAQAAWRALARDTPEAAAGLARTGDDRLPCLRPALKRFLEELPAPGTGLGSVDIQGIPPESRL
jgi:hypothetical protein